MVSIRTVLCIILCLISIQRIDCFTLPSTNGISPVLSQSLSNSRDDSRATRLFDSSPSSVIGSCDGYDSNGEKQSDNDGSEKNMRTAGEQDVMAKRGGPNSKREMLSFALPALGIFLSAPLLSNIDNAFVGRTVGTAGLAALSPATICTDQMLYLFSFLSRATTGYEYIF